MIPTDEKIYVENGMVKYGGSFVSALGHALMHADPINAQKIKDAWPKYWEESLEIGKKLREGENKEVEEGTK